MKTINGAKYKKKGGIYYPYDEAPSSRLHSWITLTQIEREYPEFIDRIAEILYYPAYTDQMKNFARGILNWMTLWDHITWKQFDSIFRIVPWRDMVRYVGGRTMVVESSDMVSVKRDNVSFTFHRISEFDVSSDRALDRLHEKIFGCYPPCEEELEYGMVRKYRNDGSRYFALDADLALEDFVRFPSFPF